ncbi:tRNA dihydrouridine(20/20a) synthase DusA [Thioclava litoralis]|uniref:tRNA-dihydrouridine(20/20a) synthase n=1 Tax=Thioclava litoralis TaxID=3076557 RepID=A0ABZ1DYK4_9RHOB|nr:tRNA dihydrouridine(20/20a) synthase DusA [Thioclava sp. FTW29]
MIEQSPEIKEKSLVIRASRLSIAPMMDWTDRHCRFFHRQISRHALLYTEMVTAPAIVHGDRRKLLEYNAPEHPVALQLGGSDPAELRAASAIANDWGYDEINLNCGCPSDRVQSGAFGAVLMKTPELVAECVSEMGAVSTAEVTVKCRIGVDDQDPQEVLPRFLETVSAAGVNRFTIHARKAWLQGLSPKDNREIPPLDYELVDRMKLEFPHLNLSLNGGLADLSAAEAALSRGLDGAMIGRAAYHEPMAILGEADLRIWQEGSPRDPFEIAENMIAYIESHLAQGGRLHQITRHMLGLFHARPGARRYRQILSEGATRSGAGVSLFRQAVAAVSEAMAAQAEQDP